MSREKGQECVKKCNSCKDKVTGKVKGDFCEHKCKCGREFKHKAPPKE